MPERVFYPDTDDVSSTSKVVALSTARNRTCELILSASIRRWTNQPWRTLHLSAVALAKGERITSAKPLPVDLGHKQL